MLHPPTSDWPWERPLARRARSPPVLQTSPPAAHSIRGQPRSSGSPRTPDRCILVRPPCPGRQACSTSPARRGRRRSALGTCPAYYRTDPSILHQGSRPSAGSVYPPGCWSLTQTSSSARPRGHPRATLPPTSARPLLLPARVSAASPPRAGRHTRGRRAPRAYQDCQLRYRATTPPAA